MSTIGPFAAFEDGQALARAIVDTVREPLLVLDKDLRVIAASRSFYETFQADREKRRGSCSTHWATVSGTFLRCGHCWKRSFPRNRSLDGYEVEHEFPEDRPSHHAAQCANGCF